MIRRALLLAAAGFVFANTLGCGGPQNVAVTDTNKPIVRPSPGGAGGEKAVKGSAEK